MTNLPRLSGSVLPLAERDVRYLGGQLVEALVAPDGPIVRRVEQINFRDPATIERRVSITVDISHVLQVSELLGMELDAIVLALLPKEIFLEFDLRHADGSAAAVPSRAQDAHMAQCLLIHLATLYSGVDPDPPQPVWDILYIHCFRFPRESDDTYDTSLAGCLGLASSEVANDSAAWSWWRRAAQSAEWREWLRRLQRGFLLCVSRRLEDPHREVFKFRRVESRPGSLRGRVPNGTGTRWIAAEKIAIPIHDLGRAGGEHIQLVAPDGAAISGASLVRKLARPLPYRRRLTGSTAVFYSKRTDGAIGDCWLRGVLVPRVDGLVARVRIVGIWSILVLAVMTLLQFFTNVAFRLNSGNLDAFVALALLVPSAMVTTLLVNNGSDLSWILTRRFRQYGASLAAPAMLAFAAILFASDQPTNRMILGLIFSCCLAAVVFIYLRMWADIQEVTSRLKEVAKSATSAASGVRLTLGEDAGN